MQYNEQIAKAVAGVKSNADVLNGTAKSAIGIIAFAIPPLLMLLSLIVFTKKYKLHGELADKVHEYILNARAKDNETK